MTDGTDAPERAAILAVVQLYIDGWTGDADKFRQAFDDDAWIFFTDAKGRLRKEPISGRFDLWAGLGWEISGRILSVTQAGDIATVLLGFDNNTDPTQSYVDLHTLIKSDGVWKISNKTATHAAHGGWAAER